MMQTNLLMESVGWFLVIGGVLFIFLALILSFRHTDDGTTQLRTESKGIIFLGPVPIVWGYGKKTRLISVIGIIAILFFIVFVFLA